MVYESKLVGKSSGQNAVHVKNFLPVAWLATKSTFRYKLHDSKILNSDILWVHLMSLVLMCVDEWLIGRTSNLNFKHRLIVANGFRSCGCGILTVAAGFQVGKNQKTGFTVTLNMENLTFFNFRIFLLFFRSFIFFCYHCKHLSFRLAPSTTWDSTIQLHSSLALLIPL